MALELEVWRGLAAVALIALAATYVTDDPVRAMLFGVASFVMWGFWSINSLNVTKSVGVCCTYTYSYEGLALLGMVPASLALLRALDSLLVGFGEESLSGRLFGWREEGSS